MTIGRIFFSVPKIVEIERLQKYNFELVNKIRLSAFLFTDCIMRWVKLHDGIGIDIQVDLTDAANKNMYKAWMDRINTIPHYGENERFVNVYTARFEYDGFMVKLPNLDLENFKNNVSHDTKIIIPADPHYDNIRYIKWNSELVGIIDHPMYGLLYSLSDIYSVLQIDQSIDKNIIANTLSTFDSVFICKKEKFVKIEYALIVLNWTIANIVAYMSKKYVSPLTNENMSVRFIEVCDIVSQQRRCLT